MRRWPRRILIAANVVVAICLVSSGAVYAYVHTKIDSIRTVAAPHLTPVAKGSTAESGAGLPAENILLIGNQSRAGLGTNAYGSQTQLSGSLSDVIMILHLNPAKATASLLSIPRDVFVPQPAGSEVGPFQKIDAALNDGTNGPDNLIAAITQDWGIPINHYVELNFNGFKNTVDALGGIKVDFPERVYDQESDLDIGITGCQLLNGTGALALVRARHLQYDPPGVSPDDKYAWPYDPESDLSRITRDHTFLQILVNTAKSKGLANPITANNFLDGIINQITIDPGLRDQLLPLISRFRNLNPATAPQTTLPVNQVGGSSGYSYGGSAIGDIEFPNQPLDDQTIAAWDSTSLTGSLAPTSVQVEDDAANYSGAERVAQGLQADGLPVTGSVTEGSEEASPSPTWIDYAPNDQGTGMAVMGNMTGAVMLRADPSLSPGQVKVELGSAASVSGAGAAVANGSSGSSSSGSSTSSSSSSSSSSGGSSTTTSTAAPGQESTSSGSGSLDPTPSSAADTLQPWDPRPC